MDLSNRRGIRRSGEEEAIGEEDGEVRWISQVAGNREHRYVAAHGSPSCMQVILKC